MTSAPPTPELWDAVIIGAGVAGAACAAQLMQRTSGLRVILVDRSPWPRHKVCGGCVNRAGVEMLGRLGVLDALHGWSVPLESVELRRGARTATIPHAGGRAIARSELDAALARLATDHGAHFSPETSARVLNRAFDGLWRIALQTPGGQHSHHARMVIVADGLGGSSLRDLDGFRVRVARASWMGAGATLDASIAHGAWPDLNPGVIRMCSHSHGYVGIVRLAHGAVDIAAALRPSWTRDVGGPRRAMQRVLSACAVPAEALTTAHILGCGLLTRRREHIAAPGLLVIGDAAGYVEPFTGEGMTWALASADLAAEVAAHALQSPDEHAVSAAADHWTALHAGAILPRQRACGTIRSLMRTPGVFPSLLALAHASPSMRRTMQRFSALISRPYPTTPEAA